jgi:hypothetical protein
LESKAECGGDEAYETWFSESWDAGDIRDSGYAICDVKDECKGDDKDEHGGEKDGVIKVRAILMARTKAAM